MSPQKLSRDEVLKAIRPRRGEGDSNIYRVFKRQTQPGEWRLNRREVKLLAWAVKADRVERGELSNREGRALLHVLDYRGLRGDAARYLVNYLWLCKAYEGKKDITPIPSWIESHHVQLVRDASAIPVQFTLPDRPYFIYQFRSLATIARMMTGGFITSFYYTQALSGPGGYNPYADCLLFNDSGDFLQFQRNSNVIHESMHAVQDLHQWNGDMGHKEAAAHLAQAIWLVLKRKPLTNRLASPAISDLAEEIREDLGENAGLRLYRLNASHYAGIRKALSGDYSVDAAPAKANGMNFEYRRELFRRSVFG